MRHYLAFALLLLAVLWAGAGRRLGRWASG